MEVADEADDGLGLAMQRLIAASALFLLKAQAVHHEELPADAEKFGRLVLSGAQPTIRIEMGYAPKLEAGYTARSFRSSPGRPRSTWT